jgi:hypothetical protein
MEEIHLVMLEYSRTPKTAYDALGRPDAEMDGSYGKMGIFSKVIWNRNSLNVRFKVRLSS